MRRVLLVGAMTLMLAASSAQAANLLFGIAEGVAEQVSFGDLQDKYQPLADYLGRVLKSKVTLESSQNIPSAIANLQKGRFDLMFCRPSNVAGKAMRDNKYQLVAMAKGDFAANFVVRKDHSFKKPEDVLPKTIALPEESSLMAKAGLATLRDMGVTPKPEQLRFTRYQEAVPFMLEMKFADVGIVAPAQAKAWEKKGGVVFFKSKKLPFWSIIASPKMSKADVEKMQKVLIEMEESDEGKKILAKVGVKGWVPGRAQDYVEMLSWLGM